MISNKELFWECKSREKDWNTKEKDWGDSFFILSLFAKIQIQLRYYFYLTRSTSSILIMMLLPSAFFLRISTCVKYRIDNNYSFLFVKCINDYKGGSSQSYLSKITFLLRISFRMFYNRFNLFSY